MLNVNEKVKMQEHMYVRFKDYNGGLQKTNTQLQDELREGNRAKKQVESEKAAILQHGLHNFDFRFNLYFCKNPLGSEYTVFADLEECIKFIVDFKFSNKDLGFVAAQIKTVWIRL